MIRQIRTLLLGLAVLLTPPVMAQDSDALFAAMRTDVEQALQRGDLAEVVPPRWPRRVPAVVMWQESRARAPAADRLIDAVLDACVSLGGRVS